jgi:TRAP-type C4-dicarboxylate transport system permease small subunit
MRGIIGKIEDALLIVPMAVIVVLVSLQVALRYIFGSGIAWGEELVGFLFVFMGMIGSGVAMREKRHTDLRVLVEKVPRPAAFVMNLAAAVAILFFLVIFLVSSISFAWDERSQASIMLDIPMSIPYACLALGAAFMLWEYVQSTILGRGEPVDQDKLKRAIGE